jgi:hypothetical protein
MAPEQITIIISAKAGDGPLTVNDAMRQVSDFFEMLEAAGGQDASAISWELVSARKESPFQVTARAISRTPGFAAEPIARREKIALAASLNEIVSGRVPDEMDARATERTKRIFARTLNGIGRMDIQFDEQGPPLIIVERIARTAIAVLEATERDRSGGEQDQSRIEMGSIEGDVLLTGPYRGQPAIQVRERLSGQEIWCVFSPELAQTAGPEHNWSETWANRRLMLSGQISYAKDGRLRHIYAQAVQDVDPRPLQYSDIADPNFTGGLSASDYIKSLWEEEVG